MFDTTVYVLYIYIGQGIQEWTKKSSEKQALKNLKWYGLLRQTITTNFLKAVFHRFYLVHSWIPWPYDFR